MDDLIIAVLTFAFVIGSSVLKSKNEKNKQETNKSAQHKPKSIPEIKYQTNQPVSQPKLERFERFEGNNWQSEDQQQNPFEKLRKDLNISIDSTISGINNDDTPKYENLENRLVSASRNKAIPKENLGLDKYMTKKNLARSFVMAEILGQPLAKRPYHMRNR